MTRPLVANLAISLDGYIARLDGSYDWIVGQNDTRYDTEKQFDNEGFFKSCDTVVMGHKSYLEVDIKDIPDHEHKTFLIASRTSKINQDKRLFSSDIFTDIRRLKEQEGGPIWLFGGADLVDQCLAENLVDELIIGIIPTILGQGKRLFHHNLPELPLTLIDSTVTDGIAMLHYVRRQKN